MTSIGRHLRSNIVGYIALFFAISTGGAVALDGTNSVFSDDIVNGEVKQVDVAANAVNGSKIADNQVSTLDVRNDSLPGGGLVADDLRPDSVGGSEVEDGSVTPADTETPTANVVQRVRGTAAVSTGDGGPASPVSYPLSDSTWTQKANEVETFAAEMTFDTGPQNCGSTFILLWVDGEQVGFANTGNRPSPITVAMRDGAFEDAYLFEPGTPTQHTMTAEVWDNCGEADSTVTSVKVDVIGYR